MGARPVFLFDLVLNLFAARSLTVLRSWYQYYLQWLRWDAPVASSW